MRIRESEQLMTVLGLYDQNIDQQDFPKVIRNSKNLGEGVLGSKDPESKIRGQKRTNRDRSTRESRSKGQRAKINP